MMPLTPFDVPPHQPSALQRELARPIMRRLFVALLIELAIVAAALAWFGARSPAADPSPASAAER